MEFKNINTDGLEGKTLEFANSINALVDEIKTIKVGSDLAGVKEQIKALEEKEVKDFTSEITELKNLMTELEAKLEENTVEVKDETIAGQVLEFFKEKEIKSVKDLHNLTDREYELKDATANQATTASVTGDVSRTQIVSPVAFARTRKTAFLNQGIFIGTLGAGRSRLLWTVGSYTDKTGYIAEYADTTDGQLAAATENSRGLAKMRAYQVVTAETFEDLPQFAQRLQGKAIESLELFFDKEIFSGAGADTNATTKAKVYGIKTQGSTAFSAANVPAITDPNIADLVDAASVQAELKHHKTNTVWISPALAFKLRRTKDKDGQYIINRLSTGEEMMRGHRVVTNTVFGDNEMLVGDASLIQAWVKRNISVEVERVARLDAYIIWVYLRAQALVEDHDKEGLVYIADVGASLDAIEVES